MEKWKPVKGYEELYEVSSYGRVRSLPRNTTNGRILKQTINNDGYMQVQLSKNGNRKLKRVNRLVAEAFVENEHGYPFVNHKNEIKTDNRPENLEWCTAQYNNTYNGIHVRNGKKRRKPVVLTRNGESRSFCSLDEAATTIGCSAAYISSCAKGYRGNHMARGYYVEYEVSA